MDRSQDRNGPAHVARAQRRDARAVGERQPELQAQDALGHSLGGKGWVFALEHRLAAMGVVGALVAAPAPGACPLRYFMTRTRSTWADPSQDGCIKCGHARSPPPVTQDDPHRVGAPQQQRGHVQRRVAVAHRVVRPGRSRPAGKKSPCVQLLYLAS
jgi:hypothetical protein